MEGVILCIGSLVAMVLIIAILSKAVNSHGSNIKPVFGRLIINLQDPEADMFKLEIDIVELIDCIVLQLLDNFVSHKYHPFKNI